jgi:hypothetical protein
MRLEPGRVEGWRPAGLRIDPWTVLRLARYRRRDDAPDQVWEAARAATARATALVRPAAALRLVSVATTIDGVRVVEGADFSGQAVARHLAGAEAAVAFVLTLGAALEAEVAALGARNEALEAYLLDLAGWAALEAAMRALRHDVAARLPAARVSHRLGPGHGDWPIEEQGGLTALLGDAAPARLSEHGVLVPFKSISGLLAIRRATAAGAAVAPSSSAG